MRDMFFHREDVSHDNHLAVNSGFGAATAASSRTGGVVADALAVWLLERHLPPAERQADLVQLLQSWIDDAAVAEQHETREYFSCVLDEDRPSQRKLFPSELKGVDMVRPNLLRFLLMASLAIPYGSVAEMSATATERVTQVELQRAIESAHTALWGKFIGPEGLIHDYVGELPTAEECALGKPNAIGWWSPIENGPMFTGTYLAAICQRARRSGAAADRDKARRLAQGLLACASVSNVPGFIARGMGTDGKCHYPMGSQDQTHPWFYGLHAYATSGIPAADKRKLVIDKMKEVADALEAADWKCPCDGPFQGQSRGDFKMFRHHGAAMYLFILRAMHDVTGDCVWLERYQRAKHERSEKTGKTRLEICAEGYPHDRQQIKNIDHAVLWIYVSSQGGLARLADWETDEKAREQYRAGLAVNARGALAVIDAYKTFDNSDTKVFGHARWREAYPAWFPQKTQADAERLAATGDRNILGERKRYEASRMRNPLAAAALVALAGYRDGFESVRRAICHYDYVQLNMAEFFFAECAYYALSVEQTVTGQASFEE